MKNIMEMVTKHWDDLDQEMYLEYKEHEDYKKAEENLDKLFEQLSVLDKRLVEEIQVNYSTKIGEVQTTAYNKGFSNAVKLMIACMK